MPMHEKGEPYTFFQRAGKRIPHFGSDIGFGQDYAQYRSVNPPAIGVREGVPRPIRNRRGGTINLQAANLQGKSEIQETRRGLKFGKTDQHVTATRRSSGSNWDGIVRNLPTKKTYLTTQKAGKQKPEPSIKNDPYSFY